MHPRWRILLLLAAPASCGDEGLPRPAEVELSWPLNVVPAGTSQPEYERVVLVTIDTLRADHVSCYGYPRRTTPFLDTLARSGVRFEQAFSTVSHTAPSHATLLTGLVPRVHGVLENGTALSGDALDLARVFGAAGFETAAALNVGFLRRIAGSFGHVEVRPAGRGEHNRNARDVVDAALAWVRELRRTPRFFLWVHLYDPHEWEQRARAHGAGSGPLWSGDTPPGFLAELARLHGLSPPEPGQPLTFPKPAGAPDPTGFFTGEKLPLSIDAYDQLILETDREVERLHAAIEGLGLSGRTLWVVTSDHGEGLASHGYAFHTGRIFQEQLRVPLVLSASDGSLGPRVVGAPVSHTDLFPTLVEGLGRRVVADARLYDARSLLPLARGEPVEGTARLLFAQRRPVTDPEARDRAELYALQDGRHKLLRLEPGPDALFDLRSDPLELVDLGDAAAQASALHDALERLLRTYAEHAPDTGADEPLPDEVLEELRNLGYAR